MNSSSTPSTATVVDFICLFTHDLKRKQKRWQDGVLKYHTFNKRVMVYDDRSHFIGDAHWQGGGDLEPGDEFELDRGSAIVQVSDCTGTREQDLTELLDKRVKEVEKRRSNAETRTSGSIAGTTQTPRNDQNIPHFQLRHRPLNDLVGGTNRIGRAFISPHSPYQVRKMAESPVQQQDSPSEDTRPSKRRRQEESPPSKMGHARALFGTTLTLTPFSSSVSTSRSQALPVKAAMKPKNTSTSTRTDLQDVSEGTGTSTEQTCSSDPEEPEIRAPGRTAPRRVFTQRASLRELLAGNEQNWNGEHPRPRQTMPKNRPHVPEKARPYSPRNQDNVVSLFTQTEQPECLDNASQNLPRFAGTRQEPGVDKSSKSPPPTTVNEDMENSGRDQKQSAGINDDAFLNWLAQGEGALADHQTPASPTNSRPKRLMMSGSDKSTLRQKTVEEMNHTVVQNPIQIDKDEQFHPCQVTQARSRNPTPKSPRKNQATAPKTHSTKRSLNTDREPLPQTGVAEPPPLKQPRTELRIRSRQRRGLLMVAQNKQSKRAESSGRSLPSSPGTGSDVYTASRPAIPTIPLPGESKMAHGNAKGIDSPSPPAKEKASFVLEHSSIQEPCHKSANKFDSAIVEKLLDEESNKDPKPLRGLADKKIQIEDHTLDDTISEKDRTSVTTPRRKNPSRRRREKAAQVVPSDNEDEMAARNSPSGAGYSDSQNENSSTDTKPTGERQPTTKPSAEAEASSGPQITKMLRKSVKSKEIIGFTIPAEDFMPADFGIGGYGQSITATTENTDITTENASQGSYHALKRPGNTTIAAHPQEPLRESSRDDQPQKKPLQEKQHQGEQTQIEQTPQQPQIKQLPRVSNPATRGKKAARKQDAAGLPPQILVQLEPFPASSRIASRNSLQRPNPVSDTARSELPGFCKPNGGAWSRHAEDLLGMTRPSKAAPR